MTVSYRDSVSYGTNSIGNKLRFDLGRESAGAWNLGFIDWHSAKICHHYKQLTTSMGWMKTPWKRMIPKSYSDPSLCSSQQVCTPPTILSLLCLTTNFVYYSVLSKTLQQPWRSRHLSTAMLITSRQWNVQKPHSSWHRYPGPAYLEGKDNFEALVVVATDNLVAQEPGISNLKKAFVIAFFHKGLSQPLPSNWRQSLGTKVGSPHSSCM